MAIIVGLVLVLGLAIGGLLIATGGDSDTKADDRPTASTRPSASPTDEATDGATSEPSGTSDPFGDLSPSPGVSDELVPYVVLSPGECFDHPALSSDVDEVERKSCSSAHDAEAISNATLTGTYDSEADMQKKVLELCEAAATKRLKTLPADGTTYYTYAVYPTRATYEIQGQDQITCALTQSGSVDGKKMTKPLPG
ncbi:hypothetical protein [Streptomyces sp. GC420]|uniref:hypothetical protein n=1 Tax=Streptomyces sp. GC420 TaxID=2697568 RepID=UPI001414D546|nr:hypothetical protein [Streptomyces sp. GC420]NBM16296.1 hypothetical protein [Streptomyces sp. GC420]